MSICGVSTRPGWATYTGITITRPGGVEMSLLIGSKIGEVDHAIDALLEERRQYTDPLDILFTNDSIDRLLDDRIQLMRAEDGS